MDNESSYPARMRTIAANGIRFAYLEEGSGPLVLMLHGFPDTPHTWDDIRPRVAAKGYRVVAPYMRGYRPTEIPRSDPNIETLARDALGLIEALGAKDAILIGHDWGAAAAYGAAVLGPERITKLVPIAIPHPATLQPTPRKLWASRHFVTYKVPGAARRFAKNDALRKIYARWSPDWTPSDEELAPIRECFADEASREAAFGYYRALALTPPKFLRATIAVPTVAFAGTGDPQAKPADFEGARRMFRGSYEVEAMPGGHFLHREHPETFATRLLAHFPPTSDSA